MKVDMEVEMAREEAIAFFKDVNECTYGNLKAVGMAIEAPCEDAVSRKAVLEMFGYETAIYDLPSVTPAQSWIPISERLPEENGRYLVTRGLNACGSLWNRVYIVNYSDLMGLKSERIWWDGNVGKSDFKWIEDVVAWMPLPEPYKGDKE